MKKICLVVLVISSMCFLGGCASQGINGSMLGAGIGAITGQAIGHNTESTLIGAGVGTFLGYAAGNEVDKFNRDNIVIPRQQYNTREYHQQVTPQQQYRRAPQRRNWQEGW